MTPARWETFHLVEVRQLLERNNRAGGRRAGLLLKVGDHPAGGALDLPDGGGGARDQDEEHAPR
ncbi:MAG TPA: hypothetical protein VIV12_04935, partial [Streptosporangiaceae bacterium]